MAAAAAGRLPLLQWARATGCPWDEEVCEAAARDGHLEVLEWLRAQGCPWNTSINHSAGEYGHVHVMEWAHANGMPWDALTWKHVARWSRNVEVLKWLYAKGCPRPPLDDIFASLRAFAAPDARTHSGKRGVAEWCMQMGYLPQDFYTQVQDHSRAAPIRRPTLADILRRVEPF
jgi:hypothetical protein